MSEFKTNKISPRKGTTTTIGDSGDSVSTSGGSTITNAGSISTAGITGGTINNTTGEIYLRGEVDWKPGDIKTASFTATDNQGFFVNTTSGEITVTLPASPSAGDVVGIKDYANTFDTNRCILNANGNKIQGSTTNFEITVEGSSIILIYVDSTKGWVITDASKAADITEDIRFVTASGGTETTSGDYKIHTFTGPGTFCVSCGGNAVGSNTVDYLVIAGGGGGGTWTGGGGGAGGFRESKAPTAPWTASPLATCASLPVTTQGYPITVGGGGATLTAGSNSIFSSITSAGGGHGASFTGGNPGGSGGGAGGGGPGGNFLGGTGNTPPVSPPQGQNGGTGYIQPGVLQVGGGGGGAGAVGQNAPSPGSQGGNGGNGVATSINGSSVTRAGGGGGAADEPAGSSHSTGGSGGGGRGSYAPAPVNTKTAGTVNTGSGGGGGGPGGCGSGGSGIVIIRYKYQ